VRERFYDDQTPIWDQEIEERRVLYPWRASFHIVIYSGEPIAKLYTGIENYVDGYSKYSKNSERNSETQT